ncbi:dephospho-CoA kinase [Anaerococcus porci]|uniref:dephospho-CoA kinase n=1 Tax=Anaerococcus porci TaxID=2652269 RepID=UPI002A7580AA|nr:dephospho-CoA kinase [Anaerococcus porci]MDY3006226.1 dephospho-CoA kinase [Anaerococcus porci]
MNPSRIVITGTIASGKSSLSQILRDMGYEVIDADLVNRELLKEGGKNYIAIKKIDAFKGAFLDGKLDKKVLASIIFDDPQKREILNKISHKNIVNHINHMIENYKGNLIFVEIPLFFQMKEKFSCDYIWLVKANRNIQIKRLIKRDKIRKDYAIKKIESQNQSLMEEKSDIVFDNSSDLSNLKEQVDRALKDLEKV